MGAVTELVLLGSTGALEASAVRLSPETRIGVSCIADIGSRVVYKSRLFGVECRRFGVVCVCARVSATRGSVRLPHLRLLHASEGSRQKIAVESSIRRSESDCSPFGAR
jgi:hypothetical protein